MQMKEAHSAPKTPILINQEENIILSCSVRGKMRKRPYPPSFKSTPAKIIDPAMGASTWAFGSQRCPKYTGILTKNAITNPKYNNFDVLWVSNGSTLVSRLKKLFSK